MKSRMTPQPNMTARIKTPTSTMEIYLVSTGTGEFNLSQLGGTSFLESSTSEGLGTFRTIATLPMTDNIKKEPSYLGDEFNAVIIAVTIVLCIVAVTLNLGIMSYYWPKIKNLIPFLYYILSTSDFVTGMCAGIHSIIFVTIMAFKNEGFNSLVRLIMPCYFITVITFKVSAFVSMIFAVIRTINIASPFTRIKRKLAIVAIFVWLFIWVAVSSLEIGVLKKQMKEYERQLQSYENSEGGDVYDQLYMSYVNEKGNAALMGYFYQPNKGKVFQSFLMDEVYGDVARLDLNEAGVAVELEAAEDRRLKTTYCIIGLIYTASPVFLCASITLIATIIQVAFLLKKSVAGTVDPEGDLRKKKKISLTIILIGAVFIACATCTLLQPLIQCFTELRYKFSESQDVYYRTVYVAGNIPFFLNAALNPLILVLRVSPLRVYMWDILTRTGRRSSDTEEKRKQSRAETFVSQASSSSLFGRFLRKISKTSM